ncbi:MAG TPA: hypothetical protein VH142_25255 [Polyangiaceae bacterium]|jgi:hypothetical protein|nr:hypothetical protein [Polyangiaceae bacterium]
MTGTPESHRGSALNRALGAIAPFALFFVSPFVVYPLRFIERGLLDGGDDAISNLPFLLRSARALLTFDVFWTPSLWLGAPLLDEPEFGTFYLPRFVLLLFSPVTAFGVYVIGHFVLAQSSFYLYLRSLDRSRAAAVFGALAYGFSGFLLGHRGHTMYLVAGAWAPLFLFFVRRAELRKSPADGICAALSFAMLPLSGAVQLTVYLAVATLVVQGVSARRLGSMRPLVVAIAALALGSLVGMVQILPSLAFERELVGNPRQIYDFSVFLSYDPRLLPLLVVPHDPLINAEIYSRVGAVVFAFACAGLAAKKSPVVLGWTVALALALVLMFGRHVPLLQKLLVAIPVVNVFRGPARHNFEFALATSVLAAHGFDAIFFDAESTVRRPARWFIVAIAGGALTAALGFAALHSTPPFEPAKSYLKAIKPKDMSWGTIATTAAFVLVGAGSLTGFWKGYVRKAALVVALLAPLVEDRISLRFTDRTWPDYAAEIARAERLFAGARVLPPPFSVTGLDALSANTAALLGGVQNLVGYASMAPRDDVTLLDLDMQGHPNHFADLAWSRLPSIYGVTKLVLPDAICDPVDFGVGNAGTGECIEPGTRSGSALPEGYVFCSESFGAGVTRFGVDLDLGHDRFVPATSLALRGAGSEAPVMAVTSVGPREVDGHIRKWFDEWALPEHGTFTVAPIGAERLRFSNVTLLAERLEPVGRLGARESSKGVERLDGSVVLAPESATATLASRFTWPDWLTARDGAATRVKTSQVQVELDARAMAPLDRAVSFFVDRVPPTEIPVGRLRIPMERLENEFTKVVATVDAPQSETVSVRATYSGAGALEISGARLLAGRRRVISRLPGEYDIVGDGVSTDGALTVEPGGFARVEVHLPTRPLTVALEVEAQKSVPVVFGLKYDPPFDLGRGERALVPVIAAGRQRFTFTASVPASVVHARLFANPAPGVRVTHLDATSACPARRYVRRESLGKGLAVYDNLDALPRVFSVTSVWPVKSVEEAEHVLREDPAFDPVHTALVEGGPDFSGSFGPATVLRSKFDAERVTLRIRATSHRSAFVVVNDRFHPRWRATIDGGAAPLYRTNGLVRGFVVPSGEHDVVLVFRPPTAAYAGAALALVGLLLSCFFSRIDRRLSKSV